MRFKLLVLGDLQSRVTRHLCSRLEDLPYTLLMPPLDSIACEKSLTEYWEQNSPSIVINLPKFSDGMDVSLEQKRAHTLGKLCLENNIPLIQLSSYRLFGVGVGESVDESDSLETLDALDPVLKEIEKHASLPSAHIILRVGWIVDEADTGLIDLTLAPLLAGQSLLVSEHNYGVPVYTRSIASAVIAMVQQILCGAENWGVFHLHSSDSCSEAEFVDHMVRMLHMEFKLDVNMADVTGVDDERRLINGVGRLVGRRCTDDFGIQFISWRNGLKRELQRWVKQKGLAGD